VVGEARLALDVDGNDFFCLGVVEARKDGVE
jgi:hypothetical protein